jgi:hypothetical protein
MLSGKGRVPTVKYVGMATAEAVSVANQPNSEPSNATSAYIPDQG